MKFIEFEKKNGYLALCLDNAPKQEFRITFRWASANFPKHCASLDINKQVVQRRRKTRFSNGGSIYFYFYII